jgi:recombination protein RecT
VARDDVAVREEDVRSLILSQVWSNRKQFGNLLPAEADADAFAGAAGAALYKNPDLALAAMRNPESLLIALRDCARLGHTPGTDEYALTLRGGAILGIEQYQGVIARMFNAGAVQAVHAEVVTRQEMLTRQDPLPPMHAVPGGDWLDRDIRVENLKGAYAYAILEGGTCSRVVIMGRAQIMTHRDKAGKNRDGVAMFWDGPYGLSMWLKTVVHELEKWVPTSASYRKERIRAELEFAKQLRQAPMPPQTTLEAHTEPASAEEGVPVPSGSGTAHGPVQDPRRGGEEKKEG